MSEVDRMLMELVACVQGRELDDASELGLELLREQLTEEQQAIFSWTMDRYAEALGRRPVTLNVACL